MSTHDVLHVEPPPVRLERIHVLVRLLLWCAIGAIGGSVGLPGAVFYFGLPAFAAVRISQGGGARFLRDDAPTELRVIAFLLNLYAYLGLLTDRFPTGTATDPVRLEVEPHGAPTLRRAALRVFTSIPAVILLALLGVVSWLVWFVSVVMVLISGQYPRAFFEFQVGVLRLHARFLLQHASIVDAWPALTLALDEPHAAVAP